MIWGLGEGDECMMGSHKYKSTIWPSYNLLPMHHCYNPGHLYKLLHKSRPCLYFSGPIYPSINSYYEDTLYYRVDCGAI